MWNFCGFARPYGSLSKYPPPLLLVWADWTVHLDKSLTKLLLSPLYHNIPETDPLATTTTSLFSKYTFSKKSCLDWVQWGRKQLNSNEEQNKLNKLFEVRPMLQLHMEIFGWDTGISRVHELSYRYLYLVNKGYPVAKKNYFKCFLTVAAA